VYLKQALQNWMPLRFNLEGLEGSNTCCYAYDGQYHVRQNFTDLPKTDPNMQDETYLFYDFNFDDDFLEIYYRIPWSMVAIC
jgi:hypothetical protein